MKFPRRLRRSSRPEDGMAQGADPALSGRDRSDDDARILRRTRLRLIAVSGLVTLFILVVLGGLVYWLVSTSVEGSARDQLVQAATAQPDSDNVYTFTVEGRQAGLIPILVDPTGVPHAPNGLARIPPGLPDQASLAAVHVPGDVDIRNVALPDGTPFRVISGYTSSASPRFAGWKVQWAQFRSGEVNLLNTLLWVLLVGGGAALLASLLAGYLYAGRALVPIRQSIDRRQAALQRQREFAANASHELRTPLTVIGASVEDLQRNRRSRVEEVGDALGDIDAEVRHMTALVEDMLLLARTDSGVVEIERVPVDLGDIAAEATSMLTALGQERNVKVVLDPLPAPLTGDPLRLRQLVTILVDNAVRHSPSGATVGVLVRAEAGAVVLQVDDGGPGIKPEDLPRLFERFWRADDAPAGGTGLGLAIARWIVEQHGGTIGAANRPEGGASFWVRLPVVGLPAAAAEADAAGPLLGAPVSGAGPDASAPAAEPPSWTPGEEGGPIS